MCRARMKTYFHMTLNSDVSVERRKRIFQNIHVHIIVPRSSDVLLYREDVVLL